METALLEPKTETPQSKKCPYCTSRFILRQSNAASAANSWTNGTPPVSSKWYFSKSTLVMAVACLGPLALPLVWLNPRYRVATKIVITAVILGLTVAAFYLTADAYMRITEQIRALGLG